MVKLLRNILVVFFYILTFLFLSERNFSKNLSTEMHVLKYKVLVLDYYNKSKRLELTHISQAISSSIEDIIKKNPSRFEIISRKQWRKVTLREEIKIKQWSKEETALRIGKALAADVILLGSFNIKGEKIYLTSNLINLVKNGKGFSNKSKGPAGIDTMDTLEAKATSLVKIMLEKFPARKVKKSEVIKITKQKKEIEVFSKPTRLGAIWRSAFFPGWGQFYRKRTEKGWYFTAINFTLGATLGLSAWQAVSNWNQYSSLTIATMGEFNSAYSSYKLWDYVFWTSVFSAMGYYTWNLIDAWFFTEFKFSKERIAFDITPDFNQSLTNMQSVNSRELTFLNLGIRMNMKYIYRY